MKTIIFLTLWLVTMPFQVFFGYKLIIFIDPNISENVLKSMVIIGFFTICIQMFLLMFNMKMAYKKFYKNEYLTFL